MYFNNTFQENCNYWNIVTHYSIKYLEMCKIDTQSMRWIDQFQKIVYVLFSQILLLITT